MNGNAMAPGAAKVEQKIVDTIRTLSMDGVQKANSGHPGMPMGAADFATVLWTRHMRIDPSWPEWPGRDRFVLSAGHGSMLLYSLLHLAGFDLSLDELKRFRQLGSKTPGHPEFGHTPGVETTTGPLGQGIANAVGIALAERVLAAKFPNQPDGKEGHRTFCLAGDGDLMEGVCYEACSLAGQWKLGRLVVWYDSNDITIDGSTDLSFREDAAARFRAMGWHVVGPIDGHDRSAIDGALQECLAETERPSLIIGRTKIGHGSPNFEGKSKSHGAPLGPDEVALVKEKLGLDPSEHFHVPSEVSEWFAEWRKERAQDSAAWKSRRDEYRKSHSEEAKAFDAAWDADLPQNLLESGPKWETGEKLATRKAGHLTLQQVAKEVPDLIAGSADLFESNLTNVKDSTPVAAPDFQGRNVYYGIREHAMGSIVNGMVVHGGVRAFGSTFLVFSDYMRPPIRLAALMKIPAIHVFTHDSVHLGEDGPTHQPVEHLDALRAIPNLHVVRPADARETVDAWQHALRRRRGPTLLVLTRQALPVMDRADGSSTGAGIVRDCEGTPDAVLVGTGSEVSLCVETHEKLRDEGIATRVVTVPCLEAFAESPADERGRLLPADVPRVIVEAGTGQSWGAWLREQDAFLGVTDFGASGPGAEVARSLGLDADVVARRVRDVLRMR